MPIELTDPNPFDRAGELLTPEALDFLEQLHQRFAAAKDLIAGLCLAEEFTDFLTLPAYELVR